MVLLMVVKVWKGTELTVTVSGVPPSAVTSSCHCVSYAPGPQVIRVWEDESALALKFCGTLQFGISSTRRSSTKNDGQIASVARIIVQADGVFGIYIAVDFHVCDLGIVARVFRVVQDNDV